MRHPLLLILLAVAVSYGTIWAGTFQFDDYNVIVHNPVVHSWTGFCTDLPRGIRPILKFTYTWNWVSNLGLFGFHLVNLLIHAANSLLLFFLAQRLFPAVSNTVALVAALLFAVHPVQTEAVTYICGRSGSLMALFYLASLHLYLMGLEQGRWVLSSIISPLLFVLAVLSKEVAVTLPLALVLCQQVRIGRGGARGVVAGQGVHWLILFALAWFVLAHPGYGRLLEACFDIRGIAVNLLTQVHAIAYLVTRLVLPWALNIDPDLPVITTTTGQVTGEMIALAALIGVGGLCRRTAAGFGILWFCLHLLPTNSLIPRLDVANDRQLYLASWGLFLGLAVGAEHLAARWGRGRVVALGCLVLIALGGLTLGRNWVYRSEVALWEETALQSPAKARVYNNLGYAYELAHRPAKAAEAYGRALALDADSGAARTNLRRLCDKKRGGE